MVGAHLAELLSRLVHNMLRGTHGRSGVHRAELYSWLVVIMLSLYQGWSFPGLVIHCGLCPSCSVVVNTCVHRAEYTHTSCPV
jgi:hypothetical protein